MTRILSPLRFPYALALRLKNTLLDRSLLPTHHLAWPVISIGNLSTGGSGKTPFTLELARLLQAHGNHVDILSRGYGRRSSVATERVPANTGDARRYGDEPVLLARTSRAPVYVSASRYQAGLLAEQQAAVTPPPPDREVLTLTHAHLLDDGFQHRKLARAADIVLLHPRDLRDTLLPAGRLREPFAALARAHFLVLREGDTTSEPALARLGIHTPIWRVRRTLRIPPIYGPAVAFAAIAHPHEFFAELRAAGIELTRTFAFRDHRRFYFEDLVRIARAAQDAAALLTTEKDWVRLTEGSVRMLAEAASLRVVALQTELLDAPRCIAALLAHLAASRSMRK